MNALNQITVVIVEDQPAVLWAVTELLSRDRRFAVVESVVDSRQVMMALDKHRPNIVAIDTAAGRRNAIDVARDVKLRMPETKVVLLCDEIDDKLLLKWKEAGVDAYCQKSHLKDFPKAARAVVEGIATEPLSEPEMLVLMRLRSGASNKEIAADLGMDLRTVRTHVRRLLEKTMQEACSAAYGVFQQPEGAP